MQGRLRLSAIVALVLLLAACAGSPPAATPTLPPTAVPKPTTGASTTSTTVAGTIDGLAGRVLTVTTNAGEKRPVQLPDGARIEQEGQGTPADLQPGLGVGVTGKADGTAVSIRIFPAALGTPKPGQFPMAGANQGNLMTNSVIQSFDGTVLTVNAGGTAYRITVPAGVEILKPIPATLADLQAGKRVLAAGVPGADGVLVAASINILGNPPQLAQ